VLALLSECALTIAQAEEGGVVARKWKKSCFYLNNSTSFELKLRRL